VNPNEVSLIALLGYDPIQEGDLKSIRTEALLRLSQLIHSDPYIRFYNNYKRKYRNLSKFKLIFERLGLLHTETCIVQHHTAHSAVAYRSSPWGYGSNENRNILVLTADGSGDGISSSVNIGTGGNVRRIAASSYYDS
jgi:carbamoyltransferase